MKWRTVEVIGCSCVLYLVLRLILESLKFQSTDNQAYSPAAETALMLIETRRDSRNMSSASVEMNASISVDEPRNYSSSPLNDQTIPWDTTVHRHWLDPTVPNPPAMLLLTNFGWNQPNQTLGLDLYRGLRTSELIDGVVNHPWFHPTAWQDIEAGRMKVSKETRYYVFLDAESCGEMNYKRYGHGWRVNRDLSHGLEGGYSNTFDREIRASVVIRRAPYSRYVIFNCGGFGLPKWIHNARKRFRPPEKFAVIHLSTPYSHVRPWDQGLPPPLPRKFSLTPEEERDIMTCKAEISRSILISFSGQVTRSKTRDVLWNMHDGKDIVVATFQQVPERIHVLFNTTDVGEAMERLAKASVFSAASKGDNLFSYRFSEVMACGSIPVVYADNWVLPFGSALINWTEAVVVIREADTNKTREILKGISLEQRCKMRQKMLEIYKKYIAFDRGVIRGLIENFELAATGDFPPAQPYYWTVPEASNATFRPLDLPLQ